jgi:DNA integrity scanning protein DisA with diadenylate cyclase activity
MGVLEMRELFFPELRFYRLHKMARAVHLDADLRKKFRENTEAVMDEFGLTLEERAGTVQRSSENVQRRSNALCHLLSDLGG